MLPSGMPPASPRNSADIFQRLKPHLGALDQFMREQVAQFEPEIRDMAAYCLDSTGKRLRPSLVFIAGWNDEGTVAPDLVKAAGVVEMVHLATLVHDDIMDLAELRRGRPTAAREFGADAAVLLGDALFSQALHIASHFPTTEVCRVVSESTRKVCSGEIMQTLRRKDLTITLAEYRRMIDLKTAELFRTSCYLGAMLAGYPAVFAKAADRFGHHLGIAYQVYDDLVDFVGDEKRQGKTLGTDLATGKLTLPLMLLLDRISASERDTLMRAFASGSVEAIAESRGRMVELGVTGEVVAAIDAEVALADEAIAPHTALPPVSFLRQLSEMLQGQVRMLGGSAVSR